MGADMTVKMDDLSVAIGRLQEGQTQTHRRIDELVTKVTAIVDNMDRLPPSPICIEKHIQYDNDLANLKVSHAVIVAKASIIGGTIGAGAAWLAKMFGFPPPT